MLFCHKNSLCYPFARIFLEQSQNGIFLEKFFFIEKKQNKKQQQKINNKSKKKMFSLPASAKTETLFYLATL